MRYSIVLASIAPVPKVGALDSGIVTYMKPDPPVIMMFFTSGRGSNLVVPVKTGASFQIPYSSKKLGGLAPRNVPSQPDATIGCQWPSGSTYAGGVQETLPVGVPVAVRPSMMRDYMMIQVCLFASLVTPTEDGVFGEFEASRRGLVCLGAGAQGHVEAWWRGKANRKRCRLYVSLV